MRHILDFIVLYEAYSGLYSLNRTSLNSQACLEACIPRGASGGKEEEEGERQREGGGLEDEG